VCHAPIFSLTAYLEAELPLNSCPSVKATFPAIRLALPWHPDETGVADNRGMGCAELSESRVTRGALVREDRTLKIEIGALFPRLVGK